MQPLLELPVGSPSARDLTSVPSPRVHWVPRNGLILHPSPLARDEHVLALNLARGCLAGCPFCSVRAYPQFPGDSTLLVYRDTAALLDEELSRRSQPPRAVFLCPSTDPFPGVPEVQAEAVGVLQVLARHGVEAWVMTRGLLAPEALDTLELHRHRVRVTVALTTLDYQLASVLEPHAATPCQRLQQIDELRRRGVPVQASIEPLIAGLTDGRAALESLLEALARVGVRHVTASYLFLRPGIAEHLRAALEAAGLDASVLDAYAEGRTLEPPGMAAARFLRKDRRQRGYSTLMALAAGLDITVSVSGTTNPDFPGRRRTATPAGAPAHPPLRTLFLQACAP